MGHTCNTFLWFKKGLLGLRVEAQLKKIGAVAGRCQMKQISNGIDAN